MDDSTYEGIIQAGPDTLGERSVSYMQHYYSYTIAHAMNNNESVHVTTTITVTDAPHKSCYAVRCLESKRLYLVLEKVKSEIAKLHMNNQLRK